MELEKEVETLKREFKDCEQILTAIGEPVRQYIILQMINCNCTKEKRCLGMRVGEITKLTHLSRPAVSHHLSILKQAGVISVNRKGTMNFYHFNEDAKFIDDLITLLQRTKFILNNLPSLEEDFD